MNRIILQPAADKASQINYNNTITSSIKIDRIVEYITSEQEANLRELYPSGEFKIWGVDFGIQKVKDWDRITRGDVVLFAKHKIVYSSATVTAKFRNKELAEFLWGYKEPSITWEYLYFLDELTPQNISYVALNRTIPKGDPKKNEFYADNKNIQGFQVLSELQSESVFAAFADLESETYYDDTITNNREATVNRLDKLDYTDKHQVVKTRKEQQILKEWLFGKKTIGTCGICNRDYPVSFLVAAHIKKRSKCSHEERINPDVVMPMCKMGCDELYEKGFIGVREGKVVAINRTLTTISTEEIKNRLVGNNCKYYGDQTIEYFSWHFQFHTIKS